MTKAIEIREQMAKLATQARTKYDEITDKTDETRAKEIEQEFDRIMADHDKLGEQLQRAEQLEKAEKRWADAQEQGDSRKPAYEAREQMEKKGAEYREVFAKAICGKVELLTQEERQVLQQGMTEFRAQTGSTTTAGGFTVPTTLADFIVKSMAAWGPMYDEGICTTIPTTSGNPMKIPTVDDTGVTAEPHTEGAALTDDGGKDATFGQRSLDAYAFDTEFIRWSWELDMDSIFSMEQLLGQLLGERLGRIANLQLTTGTGSSAPHGIVTASTQGKAAASATAITSDEILDLVHSVDPAYRQSPKTRFMFNDSTLLALRKLKDGQGNYLLDTAPDGTGVLKVGAYSAPYSINQAMASIATGNRTIAYGDFGKYYVRKVGKPVIGVLKERFWPDMGIAGLIRFDGELGDTAAVKHLVQA